MKTGNIWGEFEWDVSEAGYCWRETHVGQALVPVDPSSRQRRYRPFSKEHSGLFRIFAETAESPESLLRFANKYGRLGSPVAQHFFGDGQLTPCPALLAESSAVAAEGLNALGFTAEPFDADKLSWLGQLRRLRGVLDLRAGTAESGELSPLVNEAKTAITQVVVNEQLASSVSVHLARVGQSPRLVVRLVPCSLMGAIWLQAAASIAEPTEFRACRVCGNPIKISRTDGARTDVVFCSNACKTRDYRQRRDRARTLARKRWSPARIAKELGTDPKTVRGWLV